VFDKHASHTVTLALTVSCGDLETRSRASGKRAVLYHRRRVAHAMINAAAMRTATTSVGEGADRNITRPTGRASGSVHRTIRNTRDHSRDLGGP